jgi:flagellar biosynthesis protein FlhA
VLRESTQSDIIYFVAGATMSLIGFMPGFPWYIMLPLGVMLFFVGLQLRRSHKLGVASDAAKAGKTKKPEEPGEIGPVAPPDPLSLELGYALIPLVDREKGAELLERIRRIRSEAGFDLGLPVPKIRIIDNMQLEHNQYSFKIKGIEAGRSSLRMGYFMCINTGNATEKLDGEETRDPAFDLPALWIREDDKEKAFRAGYEVVDPPTIIATHITQIIKAHAAEIIGRQEVRAIIDRLQKDYPVVADEVGKIGLGVVQKVLQGLLREQVSIRNTVVIFEVLSDYAEMKAPPWALVEKVRQALGRQICLQYADAEKVLRVFTVENDFLAKLIEGKADTADGPVSALNPTLHHAWIAAVSAKAAELKDRNLVPVILCPEEARRVLKSSTEREMPALVVLSIPEIPSDIKIESLGEVHVG